MYNFETGVMTAEQAKTFADFHDNEIGTEYEKNESGNDDGLFYFVCFDLTAKELNKLHSFMLSLGVEEA